MMVGPGSGHVDRHSGTQKGRDRFMKDRSSRKTGLVCFGITALDHAVCKGVQAQVKLEYKFPEEKKLVYKTTSKLHQSLTFMGMEVERSEDRFVIDHSRRANVAETRLCQSPRKSNPYASKWRYLMGIGLRHRGSESDG